MALSLLLNLAACNNSGDTAANNGQEAAAFKEFSEGSYGYDLAFMQQQGIACHELVAPDSSARVMIIPAWQGRVMTSSASGLLGASYGWINYDLITADSLNNQFNPFGGEERFWLGPEGGPFSVYFAEGETQVFENWKVPSALDTEAFEIVAANSATIRLTKQMELPNAKGNKLAVGVDRQISLLDQEEIKTQLGITDLPIQQSVAYTSENTIRNIGQAAWNEEYGFVSIWLLCMFNPSEAGVVFIPTKSGDEAQLGPRVKDDYFGKVPADRLFVRDGTVFFRVDGKQRGKIGIPPRRATPYAGSYDPQTKTLTIVTYNQPAGSPPYVNSAWGEQDNPLEGDVVNSYNDGPVADGSIMGPFYEIESSSPAALLAPGEGLTHRQTVFHFKGEPAALNQIIEPIFQLNIAVIEQAFDLK